MMDYYILKVIYLFVFRNACKMAYPLKAEYLHLTPFKGNSIELKVMSTANVYFWIKAFEIT